MLYKELLNLTWNAIYSSFFIFFIFSQVQANHQQSSTSPHFSLSKHPPLQPIKMLHQSIVMGLALGLGASALPNLGGGVTVTVTHTEVVPKIFTSIATVTKTDCNGGSDDSSTATRKPFGEKPSFSFPGFDLPSASHHSFVKPTISLPSISVHGFGKPTKTGDAPSASATSSRICALYNAEKNHIMANVAAEKADNKPISQFQLGQYAAVSANATAQTDELNAIHGTASANLSPYQAGYLSVFTGLDTDKGVDC